MKAGAAVASPSGAAEGEALVPEKASPLRDGSRVARGGGAGSRRHLCILLFRRGDVSMHERRRAGKAYEGGNARQSRRGPACQKTAAAAAASATRLMSAT